ncbi:radical SAM protein [Cutibacterium avidum]|uniref:radical SAM protein n=1 Tax=Cutibacterium avidum TaxID=33010 RepID=UPI00083E81C3|nr:radical SAM protein [Cutibacterium avidum]AOG28075.1 hypothetical protein BFS79_05565 [Cutibacterium avidum]
MMNKRTISYAYLEVTRACNEACLYCYNDSGKALKGELSTEGWLTAIRNFTEQGGNSVMFTGGECLRRRDIDELVAGANEAGVTSIGMSTNGLLIHTKRAEACMPYLDEIDISLDGFREHHDRIRGVRSWDRTVEAIRTVKEVGIPVIHVNGCLTADWFNQLEDYLELLVSLGVTGVKFATIGAIGRAGEELELKNQTSQPRRVVDQLAALARRYQGRINVSTSFSTVAQPITLERFGAVIDPCGKLYPQLGKLDDCWCIGSAVPVWGLNETALLRYETCMHGVEEDGVHRILQGEQVEWWALIRSAMEAAETC